MSLHYYDSCFYSTVCQICLQHPVCEKGFSMLKSCSGCRLVSYCTAGHQRDHWPEHKVFCKALRRVLLKMNAAKLYSESLTNCSFQDWNTIRLNMLLLIELELKRKLTTCETQLLLFPRVCNICHSPQAKLLRDCEMCLCVSYCSSKHQEEDRERHTRDCKALKLCLDLDMAPVNKYCNIKGNVCQSFKDFSLSDIPGVMSKLRNASFLLETSKIDFERILETDMLSCPMTVIYVAYQSLHSIKKTLSIEFVGASEYEISLFCKWEELFHWFPDLNILHLSFIGPELPSRYSQNMQCCDDCVARNVQLKTEFYPGMLYSSFITERTSKPDLIVAFNCGFGEFFGSPQDTWFESIPLMLQNGIPLAITSYTLEEALLDLRCVKEVCSKVSVVVECEKNIFGSQRPHRDWEAHENVSHSQVFYKNSFLTIFDLS